MFFRTFGIFLMTIGFLLFIGETPDTASVWSQLKFSLSGAMVGFAGFGLFKLSGGSFPRDEPESPYAFHARPRRDYWQ
jgi:hypothetical protein